jgi:hypothetical protein
MRSHRGSGLGGRGIGAAMFVLALAVAPTARAQPGYGPDPFWPYNRQYSPYTSPMGSASPMGGGSEMWMRQGFRGANQFQDYLSGVTGTAPSRLTTDRAGIGMPGYRSAVDGTWGGSAFRNYQPNVRTTPTFEETQRRVSDTYFAYFSERDPQKRAALLKEYRQVRRESERVLGAGPPSPTRVLDSALGTRRGSTAMRRPGFLDEDQPSDSSRSAGSARGRASSSRSAMPPPPPPRLPSVGSSRAGGRSRTTPSRVLDRAGGMDDRNSRTPSSTTTTPRSRRSTRPSNLPPPEIP